MRAGATYTRVSHSGVGHSTTPWCITINTTRWLYHSPVTAGFISGTIHAGPRVTFFRTGTQSLATGILLEKYTKNMQKDALMEIYPTKKEAQSVTRFRSVCGFCKPVWGLSVPKVQSDWTNPGPIKAGDARLRRDSHQDAHQCDSQKQGGSNPIGAPTKLNSTYGGSTAKCCGTTLTPMI